jgi:hypothetical protein
MILIENDYQIQWEELLRKKFGTFPISINNTGMLSIDQTIGFMEEQISGTDAYAESRITKLEEMLGVPPSGGSATVRKSEFFSFLLIKYKIINIAPENRQTYFGTPEGQMVFSRIASELGDKLIPNLDYN